MFFVAPVGSITADVSQSATVADWQCLKSKGVDAAIVRAWHSYGAPDASAPASLLAARQAGIQSTDVYLFPCSSKGAAAQINGTVASLASAGVAASMYSTVWLDIEANPSSGCGWSDDLQKNCDFIGELIAAASDAGVACGVYASHYEWRGVAGLSCDVGKALPLWYAHYDGNASCGDFAALPFGGWDRPTMKQYNDTLGAGCELGADVSVRC